MIIAYYPGAGGNRYLQKILNKDWTEPDRSYDNHHRSQLFQHRYLLDPAPQVNNDYVLTHCMNSEKIQQVFPGRPIVFIKSNLQISLQREWMLHGHKRFCEQNKPVVASRLEHYLAIRDPTWPLITDELELNRLPDNIKQEVEKDYKKVNFHSVVPGTLTRITEQILDKIKSAYEIITWHIEYYQKYPVDFDRAHSVIDVDNIDQCVFGKIMSLELSRYHSEVFTAVWDEIVKQQCQSHNTSVYEQR